MQLTFNFFFFFNLVIFTLGILGFFLSQKNYFLLLISIEILFIAINLNFAISSLYLDDFTGVFFIIFILAIWGAEVATGLALFILALYVYVGWMKIFYSKNEILMLEDLIYNRNFFSLLLIKFILLSALIGSIWLVYTKKLTKKLTKIQILHEHLKSNKSNSNFYKNHKSKNYKSKNHKSKKK